MHHAPCWQLAFFYMHAQLQVCTFNSQETHIKGKSPILHFHWFGRVVDARNEAFLVSSQKTMSIILSYARALLQAWIISDILEKQYTCLANWQWFPCIRETIHTMLTLSKSHPAGRAPTRRMSACLSFGHTAFECGLNTLSVFHLHVKVV